MTVVARSDLDTLDAALGAWRSATSTPGRKLHRTARLELVAPDGSPIAVWTLTNAWPPKLQLGTTRNGTPQLTVTLAATAISRTS